MLCCREDEPRITRRFVENADEMDLADHMVKKCTDIKAAQLTIEVLNQLENKELAEKLSKAMASRNHSEYQPKYMSGELHLIDKHRVTLINGITSVDGILDRLLHLQVINQETYANIRSCRTSFEKMRELLCQGSIQSSTKGKDMLYDVLLECEPFFMADLLNS